MANLSIFHAALVHCFSQLTILTSQLTSFINESEFIAHLFLLERRNAPVAYDML